MPTLNFQAKTTSGKTIGFAFPLHPKTESADAVGALVGVILSSMDREVRNHPKAAANDMIQALAIALAARTVMTGALDQSAGQLAKDLLSGALAAAVKTKQQKMTNGSAT